MFSLVKYYKENKKLSLLSIVIILITAYSEIQAALLLTKVLDSLINNKIREFVIYLLLTLSIWAVSILLNTWSQRLEEKLIQLITLGIRKDIIDTLDYVSYEEFISKGPSSYVSQLTTDINLIEEKLISSQFQLVKMLFTMIGAIIALCSYHYTLLLAVVVLALILFIIPVLFQRKIEESNKAVSKAYDSAIMNSTHWLEGFSVLRSYQKVSLMKSKLATKYADLSQAKIENTKTNSKVGAAIGIVNVISQLAIIMISGILAYNHIIPIGSLLSTGNLTGSIFNSLSMIATAMTNITAGNAILNELPLSDVIDLQAKSSQVIMDVETIETQNLSYVFENGKIVHYPDFVLEKGKNYALVGKSGSGKSTLFNILSGRYNHYNGDILINGIELKKLSYKNVESLINYVEQDSYVFNTTVLENVTLSQESDFEEDAILQSLENSSAIDCVSGLDNGLYTQLSKKSLSGGEAQRINIARSFLNPRSLLLFDEITANSDSDNADVINRNIARIKKSLKVTITHDRQALKSDVYDEIISLS